MRQVPEYVKKHWASQIGATPRDGKIPKHNETIRASWPKVPVGWLIDNHKKLIPYQEERHDDYEESPVTRLITADEADEVGEDEILMAFETADTDTAPSVRLFYEYLQCVGYDHDFYGKLVAKKLELEDAH
ncbi:hypothetical protein N431DRAFT_520798 [Stipitochalara longipes BDJ]|nr:hypothetical protein N431DRAFT_520798 [Stipitochalara longipes BDJ]